MADKELQNFMKIFESKSLVAEGRTDGVKEAGPDFYDFIKEVEDYLNAQPEEELWPTSSGFSGRTANVKMDGVDTTGESFSNNFEDLAARIIYDYPEIPEDEWNPDHRKNLQAICDKYGYGMTSLQYGNAYFYGLGTEVKMDEAEDVEPVYKGYVGDPDEIIVFQHEGTDHKGPSIEEYTDFNEWKEAAQRRFPDVDFYTPHGEQPHPDDAYETTYANIRDEDGGESLVGWYGVEWPWDEDDELPPELQQ